MTQQEKTCMRDIERTYISTDLITPGRNYRNTLPGTGVQIVQRDGKHFWGREFLKTPRGTLGYYNLNQPTRLRNVKIGFGHRHFSSRLFPTQAVHQPYNVTSLLLSKCRMNDQWVPDPVACDQVREMIVREPWPEKYRNPYFSHRCKFEIFPIPSVEALGNQTKQDNSSLDNIKQASKKRLAALQDINKSLYDTTTNTVSYSPQTTANKEAIRHQELSDDTEQETSDKSSPVTTEICSRCGKPMLDVVCFNGGTDNRDKLDTFRQSQHTWPIWPLGQDNITYDNPEYPKIILPKYVTDQHDFFCCCSADIHFEVGWAKKAERGRRSRQKIYYLQSGNGNLLLKRKNSIHSKELVDCNVIQCKSSQHFIKGKKTEARQRFLRTFGTAVPDLRDARTSGRKDKFYGYHTSIFRG